MKKTIYVAPDAEQITVRFEENIMSEQVPSARKMNTGSIEWED